MREAKARVCRAKDLLAVAEAELERVHLLVVVLRQREAAADGPEAMKTEAIRRILNALPSQHRIILGLLNDMTTQYSPAELKRVFRKQAPTCFSGNLCECRDA